MTEFLKDSSYISKVVGILEESDCVTAACPLLIKDEDFLMFSSHPNEKRYLRMVNIPKNGVVTECVKLENPNPFYNFRYLRKKKKVLSITWGRILYFDPYKRVFEEIESLKGLYFGTCFSLQSIISKNEDFVILGSWKGHFHGCLMKFDLDGEIGNPVIYMYKQKETIFALRRMKSDDDCFFFGGGTLLRDDGKDFHLRKFSISQSKVVKEFPLVHTNRINMIRTYIDPNNKIEYVLTGGADKKIVLWNEQLEHKFVTSFDCSERVQCILPINHQNYIIGGSVHKAKGGNLFHLSLNTGEFTSLTPQSLEARFIWNLYWFPNHNNNEEEEERTNRRYNNDNNNRFVMTSGIANEKVHIVHLSKYFFDSLVRTDDEEEERRVFVFDNFGVSYLSKIRLLMLSPSKDQSMLLFEGPKFFFLF